MKLFYKFILPLALFLFAGLIAFGENGPTPQVVVGSSGISDGSVTPAKLSGPIPVANGGTGATTAAAGLAALGGASLNGSSTVAFNALSINGVAPLTAAEKTQALIGSHNTPHYANSYTLSSIQDNWNGSSKVGTYFTELASGASTTITLRRVTAIERAYSARVTITSGAGGALSPAMSTVSLTFKWGADGTLTSTTSSAVNLGGGSTWSVALVSSGTRDLLFRLTNTNADTMYYPYVEIELFGAYANHLTYVGLP